MLVRTIRPQPAASLRGWPGYAACTSGLAPSTNSARPTKICAVPPQLVSTGATSPPTAARQIVSAVTSRSSSAQPVIGIAPVTPVLPSTGVSTLPNGGAVVPVCSRPSVTPIVAASPLPSVSATVTEPVLVAVVGCIPNRLSETVSVAGPVPDNGE